MIYLLSNLFSLTRSWGYELIVIFVVIFTLPGSELVGYPLPEEPASNHMPGRRQPPPYQTIQFLEKKYSSKIKNIFKKYCYDCHIRSKNLTWWQKLPILNHLVLRTRDKSVRAFDLAGGFPFLGYRSLEDELETISHQIASEKMPPPWIKFINSSYSLNEFEKESILSWTSLGIQMLKEDSPKQDQIQSSEN